MANKQQVEGNFDQAKGKVKETVGDVTDNEQMQAEGTWDRVKGAAKEAVGDVKEAVHEATK